MSAYHRLNSRKGRQELAPYKGLVFRIKLFADVTFPFLMENDKVTGLKQRDPGGEIVFPRK